MSLPADAGPDVLPGVPPGLVRLRVADPDGPRAVDGPVARRGPRCEGRGLPGAGREGLPRRARTGRHTRIGSGGIGGDAPRVVRDGLGRGVPADARLGRRARARTPSSVYTSAWIGARSAGEPRDGEGDLGARRLGPAGPIIFQAHFERHNAWKINVGAGPDLEDVADGRRLLSPYVFPGRAGRRMDRTALQKAWRVACDAAGCPGKLIHDLRRTMVRDLRRAGVPLAVAMGTVGHRSLSVHQGYSVIAREDLELGLERVEALRAGEPVQGCLTLPLGRAGAGRTRLPRGWALIG